MRDVAKALIGKENTVQAFGFAFYKPKEPRPSQKTLYRGGSLSSSLLGTEYGSYVNPNVFCNTLSKKKTKSYGSGSSSFDNITYTSSLSMDILKASNCADESAKVYCMSAMSVAASPAEADYGLNELREDSPAEEAQPDISVQLSEYKSQKWAVKEVSVGAGAKIAQDLVPDPYSIDSWCEKPESVMTIYFVFQEKLEELKAGGMKNLEGKPEGMLKGIPIG